MLRKLSTFFLHKYQLDKSTFFCRRYVSVDELHPIFTQDISLENGKSFHILERAKVFVKTTELKKITVRLRVSLMLSRGSKGYDYPLADLINSMNVEASGTRTPKLVGFGYQTKFGLVNKIALLYEHLQNYSDGLQWLVQNPDRAVELTKKVHAKILKLHALKCYHLDIWLGNVMVPSDMSEGIQLIDFEQYVSGIAGDIDSLLGFLFGYFYSRELNQVLGEAEYDALSYKALSSVCNIQSSAFQRAYQLSKQGKVNRRLRRQFFTARTLPIAV